MSEGTRLQLVHSAEPSFDMRRWRRRRLRESAPHELLRFFRDDLQFQLFRVPQQSERGAFAHANIRQHAV